MDFSVEVLQQALKNREFVLHYQPKYDVFLNKITGVEALVRWEKPDHGMVSPAEFIPAAEQTGLIHELGEWILQEAISQAAKWRLAGYKLTVAINVSPFQIETDEQALNFILTLDKVMEFEKVLVSDIQLEITEGAAISPSGLKWLEMVIVRKIPIAIDDFGTGYSSLAYLKNLRAHTLKIDKAFVDHAPASLSDCLLLEAMVDIGHSFGMVVVAEGVEEEEQVDFLKVIHCDVIQGYYYAKPMAPKDLESFFLT